MARKDREKPHIYLILIIIACSIALKSPAQASTVPKNMTNPLPNITGTITNITSTNISDLSQNQPDENSTKQKPIISNIIDDSKDSTQKKQTITNSVKKLPTKNRSISQNKTKRYIVRLKDKKSTRFGISTLARQKTVPREKTTNIRITDLQADQKTIQSVKDNAEVEEVIEDRILTSFLDTSVPLIGAPTAWNLSYTGKGQAVCIIDTGINYNHPALGSCFGPGCKAIAGYDYVNKDSDPTDGDGHGTHVAGIIASSNTTYRGVAPDSDLVIIKALDDNGEGYESDILYGIDWCITNADSYNIKTISLSLGDSGEYTKESCKDVDTYNLFAQLFNAAAKKNISVIVASGNFGHSNGISFPACVQNATSVGSTATDDTIAGYTDRFSNLDLLAPGSNIRSTDLSNNFVLMSGTSMAAPHVSAALSIINQAHHDINGIDLPPYARQALLKSTGKPVHDSLTGITYPRIDIAKAVTRILTINTTDITAKARNITAQFPDTHSLYLSHSCLNLSSSIYYDKDICPQITLTIDHLNYHTTPVILHNNSPYTNCTSINYTNGTLKFTPCSTGTYRHTANAILVTNSTSAINGQPVVLHAAYTHTLNNTPINGTCTVSVAGQNYPMQFNGNYTTKLTITQPDNYTFTIFCNSPGSEPLNTSANLTIIDTADFKLTLPNTITSTPNNPVIIPFTITNTGSKPLYNITLTASHNINTTNETLGWNNHTLAYLPPFTNNTVHFTISVPFVQQPFIQIPLHINASSASTHHTASANLTIPISYKSTHTTFIDAFPNMTLTAYINLTNTGNGPISNISLHWTNCTLQQHWLTFPSPEQAHPNATITLPIIIDIPANATPGNYILNTDLTIPGFNTTLISIPATISKIPYTISPQITVTTHTQSNPYSILVSLENPSEPINLSLIIPPHLTVIPTSNSSIAYTNHTLINFTGIVNLNISIPYNQSSHINQTDDIILYSPNSINRTIHIQTQLNITYKITLHYQNLIQPNTNNTLTINLTNTGGGPLTGITIDTSAFPTGWLTCPSLNETLIPSKQIAIHCTLSPHAALGGIHAYNITMRIPGLPHQNKTVTFNIPKNASYTITPMSVYDRFLDITTTGPLSNITFTNTGNVPLNFSFNLISFPQGSKATNMIHLYANTTHVLPGKNLTVTLVSEGFNSSIINTNINLVLEYSISPLNITTSYNYGLYIINTSTLTTNIKPIILMQRTNHLLNLWDYINLTNKESLSLNLDTTDENPKMIFNTTNIGTTVQIDGKRIRFTHDNDNITIDSEIPLTKIPIPSEPISYQCNGSANITKSNATLPSAFCLGSYLLVINSTKARYYATDLHYNLTQDSDIIGTLQYKNISQTLWITSHRPILHHMKLAPTGSPVTITLNLSKEKTYTHYTASSNTTLNDILIDRSYDITLNTSQVNIFFAHSPPSLLNGTIIIEQFSPEFLALDIHPLLGIALTLDNEEDGIIRMPVNRSFMNSLGYTDPRVNVYHCKDWDTKYHECDTEWEHYKRINPNGDYIEFTSDGFSAYTIGIGESPKKKTSGGGGSGGGSSISLIPVTDNNNNQSMPQPEQDIKTLIKQVPDNKKLSALSAEEPQPPRPVSIIPTEITLALAPETETQLNINITNPNNNPSDVFMTKAGTIADILFLEKTRYTLKPQETAQIQMKISGISSQIKQYSGSLLIYSHETTQSIPIKIIVQHPLTQRLNFTGLLLSKLSTSKGRIDIRLNYQAIPYTKDSKLVLTLIGPDMTKYVIDQTVPISGNGSEILSFYLALAHTLTGTVSNPVQLEPGTYKASLTITTPDGHTYKIDEEKPMLFQIRPLWFIAINKSWYIIIFILIGFMLYVYNMSLLKKNSAKEKQKYILPIKPLNEPNKKSMIKTQHKLDSDKKPEEDKPTTNRKTENDQNEDRQEKQLINRHKRTFLSFFSNTTKKMSELINVLEKAVAKNDYYTAKHTYESINTIYNSLPPDRRKKYYPRIIRCVEQIKDKINSEAKIPDTQNAYTEIQGETLKKTESNNTKPDTKIPKQTST